MPSRSWRSTTSSRCATRSPRPSSGWASGSSTPSSGWAPDHFESLYELVSFTTSPTRRRAAGPRRSGASRPTSPRSAPPGAALAAKSLRRSADVSDRAERAGDRPYAGAADAHLDLRHHLSYAEYLGPGRRPHAPSARGRARTTRCSSSSSTRPRELWLKLVLHELHTVAALVDADDLGPAFKSFARVERVMQGLISSWDVLSTMTPADYMALPRRARHVERLPVVPVPGAGVRAREPQRGLPGAVPPRARALRPPRRRAPPAVAVRPGGAPARPAGPARRPPRSSSGTGRRATPPTPRVVEAWLVVYREPETHWDLYELGEDLLDLEDAMRQWRLRHVTTVERIIGLKVGTGGTAGVPYLRERLQLVLFPELWDVRTAALSGRGPTSSDLLGPGRRRGRPRRSRPPIPWPAAATASSSPRAWPTWPATRSGSSRAPPGRRSRTCSARGPRRPSTPTSKGTTRGRRTTRTCGRRWPRLVGARPGEAVVMNSLTVNLHLMLRSFYRPTAERYRIVIEADVFPSDRYAVMGVARAHGLDPADAVVILTPRPGERHLRTEDVAGYLEREGASVAVVVLSAVDFRTGAFLDLPAITDAAHRAGAFIGLGPGPRGRQRPRPPARLGRRLRRVVPLQVRQLRAGCGRRLLRARAPRHRSVPGPPGRLVGARPRLPVRHAVRVRAGRGCRGLADLEPAHPGHGAGPGLPGAVRRGRARPAAGPQRAPHRVPGTPAGRGGRPPADRGHHARGNPSDGARS